MSETKLGTIGLIHGTGHRAEHWDRLIPELQARGYDTIAVDLPANDPDATYDDYARAAADAFRPAVEDGQRIDLVPHSGGSHTIPGIVRRLGVDAVRSITHISGSLGRSANTNPKDLASAVVPRIPLQRNSETFRKATLHLDDGMTVFDPAMIRRLFFNDCTPEEFIWALERMRVQAKPKVEPPLIAHTRYDIPQSYVLGEDDQIRDKNWAIRAAGALGMELVWMKGGHSPAIARPAELADIIDGRIQRAVSSEDTIILSNYLPRQTIVK